MRYLLCKDRKILGPFEPTELAALPGFAETSLICPEESSGLQPQHWQKAASAPELRALIRHGEPPQPAAPEPARRAAEEEQRKVLAALESRINLLETELAARAEPPVGHAERMGLEAPVGHKQVHESVAALHERLLALQQSLKRTHHVASSQVAELDERTQRALRDLGAKVDGLKVAAPAPIPPPLPAAAAPAPKPAAVPAPAAKPAPLEEEEEEDAPARDKLHQRVIDHAARRFGVDDLCREMGDYKAALGGVFTALAGFAGVLKGLIGIGLEAKVLHTLVQWNDFIYALPNDKNTLTIVASFVAIGTGFHQIGAANNHAAILDSQANNHAAILDSHAQLQQQLGAAGDGKAGG